MQSDKLRYPHIHTCKHTYTYIYYIHLAEKEQQEQTNKQANIMTHSHDEPNT